MSQITFDDLDHRKVRPLCKETQDTLKSLFPDNQEGESSQLSQDDGGGLTQALSQDLDFDHERFDGDDEAARCDSEANNDSDEDDVDPHRHASRVRPATDYDANPLTAFERMKERRKMRLYDTGRRGRRKSGGGSRALREGGERTEGKKRGRRRGGEEKGTASASAPKKKRKKRTSSISSVLRPSAEPNPTQTQRMTVAERMSEFLESNDSRLSTIHDFFAGEGNNDGDDHRTLGPQERDENDLSALNGAWRGAWRSSLQICKHSGGNGERDGGGDGAPTRSSSAAARRPDINSSSRSLTPLELATRNFREPLRLRPCAEARRDLRAPQAEAVKEILKQFPERPVVVKRLCDMLGSVSVESLRQR